MINDLIWRSLVITFSALLLISCAGSEKESMFGNAYIHHVKNNGATPQAGEYIYFHYKVRLDDSLVENSWTRGEPNTYKMPDLAEILGNGGKVSPVIDGIGLMSEGDSLTIYTKVSDLPMVPEGFESYEFVYYDIALMNIKSTEEYEAEETSRQAEAAQRRAAVSKREEGVALKVQDILARYNSGQLKDSIQTTASGLKYIILTEGNGPAPTNGSNVNVHYYGVLPDGTMFDNSFRRGDLFTFTLGAGQVIRGWDEGIALLKEGGAATLFIPSELGYGERGAPPSIPPNSELVFYVELDNSN